MLAGTYLTLRDFGYIKDYSFISLEFLVFSFLIIFTWVFFSGIGGFGFQNLDFLARNAVFHDLINYPWPVIYDFSADSTLKEMFGNTGALVYYFAYWLPSALVGKLLGWKIANFVLFIWTLVGVSLCILLITRYIGKASILIVLAFVFFSGLDIVGEIMVYMREFIPHAYTGIYFPSANYWGFYLRYTLNNYHLEMWNSGDGFSFLNYNSHTVQFFWVFNQSIPAWLVTLLLLNLNQIKGPSFTPIPWFSFLPPYRPWSHPLPCLHNDCSLIGQYRLGQKSTFHGSRHFSVHIFPSRIPSFRSLMGALLPHFFAQVGNHPHGFIWNLHR